MLGWFFSSHPIIDVSNGLSSAIPTGYRGAGGSDIPPWVSSMYIWNQSVPAPSPAPPRPGGMVGRTSRGRGGLALTCGGWLTTLAGSGCLSTLLGCHGRSALARGGQPSTLARGGFLSAPTGGGLTPALLLARGSRGWSLGWRRVRRE